MWGMTLGPATGRLLAEFIAKRQTAQQRYAISIPAALSIHPIRPS